jgi:urease accessory protein
MNPLVLAQALRLASPALPVGGFSYSQGLEWAVEAGTVADEAGAQVWIADGLALPLARFELPLLLRLLRAWAAGDTPRVRALDAACLAAREAREPREEAQRMGHALDALLKVLPEFATRAASPPAAWITVFAEACATLRLPEDAALTAYAMAWCENQTAAAVKLVPLGQSAAQRILSALIAALPDALVEAQRRAQAGDETDPLAGLETSLPGLAIACARHETQYTRLFRS